MKLNKDTPSTLFLILALFTLLVNATALLRPMISTGDSVLYATLSQHMVHSGNWLDLKLNGLDWLDKPHWPFWLGALSFQWLGVNAPAYVLPGLVCHLIGAFYTYRLARVFFTHRVASLSVLIYASAFFMMSTTSALKAESFLTASITGAVYHWLRYDQTSRLKHLLLGALWSGISAMTKGIFTLITIGSGWVILCIYQGRWKEFFSLKWLLALMLTMLAMTPELWALYQQFDLHPEKVVFGHTHVSGVKFFFWDSQFGRFFNTGPITGGDARDVLYYVHVFLWSFMPWSWAFGWGVWCAAKRWQTMEPIERQAWVFLLAAFFVSFVMFSATSFQLDYYTVIVYPFASIVCAQAIVQGQLAGGDAWMRWGNLTYAFLMLVGASALTWYLQVDLITWVGSLGVLTMIVMVYALRQHASWMMLVIIPALAANLFYGVSEIMTYVVFDRYSLTNQLQQVLKDEPKLPVYFHDIDPVVSMEMQLYRSVASADLARMTQPIESNHYHLVLRQDKVATWTSQNAMKLIAQGCWMEHKTGLLPRTLRILKGQEPCEVYEVFEVTQP